MARGPSTLLLLMPVLLLAAGGCTNQDPVDKRGTWQPTGVNDRNLRAMVANPRDLDWGEAATTERGNAGSLAVTRLLTERRRALLTQATSRVGSTQQQTADQPLAGPGGAAGGGAGASR